MSFLYSQLPYQSVSWSCAVFFFYFRFYSLIGPGDTISVVGDFDEMGRCIVDHAENLIIVYPDILLSGTRVIILFCGLCYSITLTIDFDTVLAFFICCCFYKNIGFLNIHSICCIFFILLHLMSSYFVQVASSFTCSRRAVLDERLKSSEHFSAALLGTLLHQIFQVHDSRNRLLFLRPHCFPLVLVSVGYESKCH